MSERAQLLLAIADDELRFEKIDGHSRTEYRHRGDYYCFCSSWLHSDRLLADFEATAILLVREPHEFFLRLATSLNRTTYRIRFNKVSYFDPLLLGSDHVTDLAFTKHMRFAYQSEHRWVAAPPSKMEALKRVDLEMGSIEDIADLYVA